jgi:hypothetical protein
MKQNRADGGILAKAIEILDLLASITNGAGDGVTRNPAAADMRGFGKGDDGGNDKGADGKDAPEGQAAFEAAAVDEGVGFEHAWSSGKEEVLF